MRAVRPLLGLAATAVSLALVGCPAADWDFSDPSDASPPGDELSSGGSSSSGSSSHGGLDGSSSKPPDASSHVDGATGGCANPNPQFCGCTSNRDCSGTNNICDSNLRQCVQCTDDNDCNQVGWKCFDDTCVRKCDPVSNPCGHGNVCNPANFCEACEVATQGDDCSPKTPICNPVTLHCVGCFVQEDCVPTSPGVVMGCTSGGTCFVNSPNGGGSSSTSHDP
jgi:hypothetical protein